MDASRVGRRGGRRNLFLSALLLHTDGLYIVPEPGAPTSTTVLSNNRPQVNRRLSPSKQSNNHLIVERQTIASGSSGYNLSHRDRQGSDRGLSVWHRRE